jgi:Ca-activated chloride channel family protein
VAAGDERRTTGLLVGAHDVPLTGVMIDVKARGTASRVTVSQRYVNREAVTVEAVYSFPLEESAAVCGFEVELGDRRIVGAIEETEKAFEAYDEAMSRGDGAYLLDQVRPNLFAASVGNLLPQEEVVVRLTYVAPLERQGDEVRLKIPTTVAPRYIPAEQLEKMDRAELERLAPPTVIGGVPYGLTLTVDFEGWSTVRSVECASHPVRVHTDKRRVAVELAGTDIQLDQDVVVTFTMAKEPVPTALVAQDEQGDTVIMLDLAAPPAGRHQPAEVVFVVDCSGSMMGSSIAAARNALLLCLRSLQKGDLFNVVFFGSSHRKLFDESRAFDQGSLDEATRAVADIDADLGGTEILSPLRDVLGGRRGRLPRRVLLLTDGEVGNEQEVIELATRHADSATIFTLGIGYGASDYLVDGLARASGGWAEFVHPNERIEPKVMRQMARVGAGEGGEMHVDWDGLTPDLVTPAELPPLFPGSTLTVYARVPKHTVAAARKKGEALELAVVQKTAEGETRLPATLDLAAVEADLTIPRLFAREAIRDLEERRGELFGARGSAQTSRKAGKAEKAILELATRYSLMSSQTSFVAVEERSEEERGEIGDAELRRIPVALLRDWHGTDRGLHLLSLGSALPQRLDLRTMMASDQGLSWGPRMGFAGAAQAAMSPVSPLFAATPMMADFESDTRDTSVGDPLTGLAVCQRADGSWTASDVLEEATGLDEKALREAASELGLSGDEGEAVVATMAVLHVLMRDYADRRDEWVLLANKAESWLKGTGVVVPAGHASLEAWIAEVVARA